MNLYKFLNESLKDPDYNYKISAIAKMYSRIHMKDLEGVSEALKDLSTFIDTTQSFCLFLESHDDFLHIYENENSSLKESEKFEINESTGFYDFKLLCNDKYDWSVNKIFLPGTLFFIFYDSQSKNISFKSFLEACKETLHKDTEVENISIEDSVFPEDLYFNGKDTGDSALITNKSSYTIKIRTFIFDYSKYQKYIDNMDYGLLTTTPGKRVTGILDEMSEENQKNFDLNKLCDNIYQKILQIVNESKVHTSEKTLEKIRRAKEKVKELTQKNQENKED